MENESYKSTRIENSKYGKRQVYKAGAVFASLFIFFFAIGALGPSVFQQTLGEPQNVGFDPAADTAFFTVDVEVQNLNQLFLVEARMSAPQWVDVDEVGVKLEVDIEVKAAPRRPQDPFQVGRDSGKKEITCVKGEPHCSWFTVWTEDFVTHDDYSMLISIDKPAVWEVISTSSTGSDITVNIDPEENSVDFDMQYRKTVVRAGYTKFELFWKYLFLCGTLLVMFLPKHGYVARLRTIRRKDWSFQQYWILLLLVLLCFFNDPFFPVKLFAREYDTRVSFSTLYIVAVTAFVLSLLLFWLCLLDDMKMACSPAVSSTSAWARGGRTGDNGGSGRGLLRHPRPLVKYWLPKVVLVGSIAIITISTFSVYRYRKINSPSYGGLTDSGATVSGVFLGLFMAVYIGWVVRLSYTCIRRLESFSLPYQLLFILSLASLLMGVVGVLAGSFYPIRATSALFLGFFATFNMYIWALAYAHAPDEDYSPALDYGAHGLSSSSSSAKRGNRGAEGLAMVTPGRGERRNGGVGSLHAHVSPKAASETDGMQPVLI